MNTPAVFGIVTAIVCVAIAVGVFLSWRFPHWGMHHTNNRPAPGVTEARYLQMYGDPMPGWTDAEVERMLRALCGEEPERGR